MGFANEPVGVRLHDPELIILMLKHGVVQAGSTALCGAGSGYTAALLSRRLGDTSVTAIDIDAYLVRSATERLSPKGCIQPPSSAIPPESCPGDSTESSRRCPSVPSCVRPLACRLS